MKGEMRLARLLREMRTRASLSQRDLAKRAGTAQSVVARIEGGATSPTLATLQRLLSAAEFELGLELVPRAVRDPVIEVYKRDIDRSLLRENLRQSPDARLSALTALAALAEEAHRAGAAAESARPARRRR